jgi:multidrug efflux pump subunit AcrA (membrane-fusion protein)
LVRDVIHKPKKAQTMIRSFQPKTALLALAATAIFAAPAAGALAQPYGDPAAQRYEDQQHEYQYQQSQYEEQRRAYDAQYGDGAYARYQEDEARRACHDRKRSAQVGGAVLGGIAGALIGNGVSRGGGREGGTIIGGVGGAAVGSSIAKGETKCD